MQYIFTPAAERALGWASEWAGCAGSDEMDLESLVIGLLSEPECRAAVMLARHGVDIPAVQQHWPELRRNLPNPPRCNGGASNNTAAPQEGALPRKPFSFEVECSLRAALDRLNFLPQPVELATEHLLLGLVAEGHEVSLWLRQQGLDSVVIEAEIRKLYGFEIQEEKGLGIGD